ncbi:MAG: ParB/RepB/Spo0J family partition protein, partial [Caulobacteraceae bacterium]
EDPEAAASRIIERGLSVRQAETLARQLRAGARGVGAASRKTPEKDADTRDLETDLSNILGLEVEIRDNSGAGELRVRYKSLEQLDDLCRRLSRPA